MWPRLILRGDDEIVVDSRGPGAAGANAAPGPSSWQTVLPLVDGRPAAVVPGQAVRTRTTIELPEDTLEDPVWYTVEFT